MTKILDKKVLSAFIGLIFRI